MTDSEEYFKINQLSAIAKWINREMKRSDYQCWISRGIGNRDNRIVFSDKVSNILPIHCLDKYLVRRGIISKDEYDRIIEMSQSNDEQLRNLARTISDAKWVIAQKDLL